MTLSSQIASSTGGFMKSASTLVQAPGGLPILGHTLSILRDPLRFLRALPTHGDLVEIRLGPFKALVVCDPDLIQQVLTDDRVSDKGGPLYDQIRKVTGSGLLTCPHREHRQQRRLVQPAFHRARFPGYTQAMTREITAVIGAWRDGQTIDVLSEMMMIGNRITAALILGSTLPPVAFDEMIGHAMTLITDVYKLMFLRPPLDRLPLPTTRRFARASKGLRTTLTRLIHDRRVDGADHQDLLSILLASRDTGDDCVTAGKDRPTLSDTEVIDQIITFFVAGMEATGVTLAWALNLLAWHPGIQQRLQAETDALPDGPARFDDLPALALTERVITETLRLYPPAWFLTRMTTSDSHLGAHPVPAGTTLIFSPYLIHHRPDLHPDPDRFDPDRWTADRTPPRHTFIPFSGGPRKCIGDTLALTEATLTLAAITAHWNLEPTTSQPPRPIPAAGLIPQRFTLRITPRHSKKDQCSQTCPQPQGRAFP
jgi:cytochrome P450